MALMKYDTVSNGPFITPTCGLYPEYVISMEEFKDQNAKIMKNAGLIQVMERKVRKSMNFITLKWMVRL